MPVRIFDKRRRYVELFYRDGKMYNLNGDLMEHVNDRWIVVRNPDRFGWWRYHEHYDRNGYCDNPGRGY